MRTLLTVGCLALALTACASSTSSAPTTATAATSVAVDTAKVDQLVALTVRQATASGFTVDEACVRRLAERLSPADLQVLIDHAGEPDVTVSAAGEALGVQLTNCITSAPSSTSR